MALPDWLAVIVQVPAATPVTVPAEIVQTVVVVEASVTESPELALAVTVPVAGLVIELGTLIVIVCAWP